MNVADKLLRQVHERLGDVGVDIQTWGDPAADPRVTIVWRRDYGEGYGLSDERFAGAQSLVEALRAVLAYEDAADAEEEEDV